MNQKTFGINQTLFYIGNPHSASAAWVYGSQAKRRQLDADKERAEAEKRIEKMTQQMGSYPDLVITLILCVICYMITLHVFNTNFFEHVLNLPFTIYNS